MESFIVLTPSAVPDAGLAIAACRAGELGLLDLGHGLGDKKLAALDMLVRSVGSNGRWGIRLDRCMDDSDCLAQLDTALQRRIPVLVLGGIEPENLVTAREQAQCLGEQVFLEVHSVESAEAAQGAGYWRCVGTARPASAARARPRSTATHA